MATENYKIRLRAPRGGATCEINPDWNIGQLKLHIGGLLNIPVQNQRLLVGFPPAHLTLGDEVIIKQLFRNGDTITVDVKTDEELQLATQKDDNLPIRDAWIGATQGSVTMPDHTKVVLVIRKIPQDNSCLFNAIGYLLENRSRTSGARIRKEVASFIEKNPAVYSDALLGRPRADYIKWISNPNSWGGEIEATVLATLYQTKIGVINIGLKRLHIYGDKEDYPRLVWLLYDGIHYDAIVLSPTGPEKTSNAEDESKDIVLFDPNEKEWRTRMLQYAETMHTKGLYTATATIKTKCQECGAPITGELGVAKHAKETGHTRYTEWKQP